MTIWISFGFIDNNVWKIRGTNFQTVKVSEYSLITYYQQQKQWTTKNISLVLFYIVDGRKRKKTYYRNCFICRHNMRFIKSYRTLILFALKPTTSCLLCVRSTTTSEEQEVSPEFSQEETTRVHWPSTFNKLWIKYSTSTLVLNNSCRILYSTCI